MASYWIVVPRGNAELFDLLSVAFRGRADFSVIMDRRSAENRPADGDRRGARLDLGPDEIIIAERAERGAADHDDRRAARRPRIKPRRSPRPPYNTAGGRAAANSSRRAYRPFTL